MQVLTIVLLTIFDVYNVNHPSNCSTFSRHKFENFRIRKHGNVIKHSITQLMHNI